MLARVIAIENRIADLDCQLAVPFHGITRIDRQIKESVFHLVGVGIGIPQAAGGDDLNLDRLTKRTAQEIVHAGNEAGDVDNARFQRLTAAKGQKLACKLGTAMNAGQRIFQPPFGTLVANHVL
ncbi:hypothetical protein D3C87_1352280 [compost metagenome]